MEVNTNNLFEQSISLHGGEFFNGMLNNKINFVKDYRDPLYGFVSVNQVEQKIIDSIYFQRLRRINQLGTTFLVYPSAMHTRFEHSLGTLFVVEQMLQHLFARKSNIDVLDWDVEQLEKAKIILRLAALLHDIGHAPFSHAAEKLFPVDDQGNQLDHEDFSYKIITETEIGEYIRKLLGESAAEEVADVSVNRAKDKNYTFLSELLAGDFGADRIDYLMRDSYHLGVQYGRFDVHRLLNTIHIRYNEEKKGPELYVEDGGLHSVEAFILARYFMFLDVYFHKTRRIFDHHLVEFLSKCLEEEKYPLNVEQYIQWDDNKVLQYLKIEEGNTLADRLLKRKHYRLAFETVDHPEVHELIQFDWMKLEVEKEFGNNVRVDEASKATYAFDQPEIFLFHHKTKAYTPLSKSSTLIKHLKKIKKCRIYADKEKQGGVTDFCKKFWKEKSKRSSD